MANEFNYASIIADTDLVDPTYDMSNIRTTTPTSERLLANVPEYSGLKFDPTQQTVYSDLYSLYSEGLDALQPDFVTPPADTMPVDIGAGDTAQIPGAVDNLVTPADNLRFDSGVTPGPSGFIGVDPDMDIDPRDIDDYATYIPSTPDYSNVTTAVAPPSILNPEQTVVEKGRNFEGNITDYLDPVPTNVMGPFDYMQPKQTLANEKFSAPITGLESYDLDPETTLGDVFTTEARADEATTARPDMLGDTGASMDYMSGALDAPYGVNPDTGIPYETPRTIADQKAVLGVVTEEDAANPKGLLEKIGLGSLDPTKTAVMAAINKAVGAPVSLLISALEALPKEDSVQAATAKGLQEQGYEFDDIGRLTTGPMQGYSVESAFGDIAQATQERIDNIENRKVPQTEASIEKVGELYDFLGDVTQVKADTAAPQEDVGAVPEDTTTGADPTTGDLPGGGNIVDEFGSDGDTGRTTGPTVSRSDPDFGQFGRRQSATQAGGGNDSPGGKSIVCTAMYQTTGLEDWSKAMKIWYIYQKKYLTIQHQEGYHKLFKPFVKGMHKSNIIKAIGAHVARHRTQDLKHVMFGSKPSWLGRIYRKILEPICYWVGKYVKK